MINIVIPAAGDGSRFKHHYAMPKPLIPINGIPMIAAAIKSLNIQARYHFVLKDNEYLQETIEAISTEITESNIIKVSSTTQGAAASVLLLEDHIDSSSELIVANCDQIMKWDSVSALRAMRCYDGAVVTYKNTNPKNSFARVIDGLVEEIKEKEVIGNIALTGIHYWAKAGYFFDSAKRMIERDDRQDN
jgi:NDP-sugar pyrophosphorylase family protein